MENSLFRLDGDVAIVTGAAVVVSNRSPEPGLAKIIDTRSLSGL